MKIFAHIFCVFLLIGCGSNAEKIKKAKSIEKGMTMEKVRHIMGQPSDSLNGYFDQSKIMFIYNLSTFESSDIEIYFDSVSKVVTHVILPKGE